MKSWLESVRLNRPLRDVRLSLATDVASDQLIQSRLRERYEQGLHDGERALSEQLLRQRAELIELQNGILESLRGTLPQVRHDCERELISLALEVAQRLVAGLPISAEMVEAAVREALASVEQAHDIAILVHAEDLALLQRANAPVLLHTVGGERLRFEVSPNVTRGGCLVQTRFGVIDARRETKCELLRKSLEESCK